MKNSPSSIKEDAELRKKIEILAGYMDSGLWLAFIVCYLFRRPVIFLFGASEASYVYADEYLKIYLFGTACSMLVTGMNGFINAQGFPRFGMLTTVVAAAWVLKFLTGKKAILRLKKEGLKLESKRVKSIVSLGVPSFVMQGSNCLVQVVCNNYNRWSGLFYYNVDNGV